MMLRLFYTATLAAIVMASCKKDKSEDLSTPDLPPTTPTNGGFTSLTVLFNQIQVPSQNFILSTSDGGTITGSKGTQITFQPNSFVDLNGQSIIGNVKIELREILSKKDMIFSNKTTYCYGYPLVSGGIFYIRATQNNQELFMKGDKPYTIKVPADTSAGVLDMNVFYGTAEDTMGGDLNWTLTDTAFNNVFYQSSTEQYFINCLYLNWINCDWFPYGADFTNLAININNYSSFNNINVYMYFNGVKSILPIWANNNTFITNRAWLNQNVTIIAIATNSDGNLFSSFSNVTIAQNMTLNFSLSGTTKDEFISQVNALP